MTVKQILRDIKLSEVLDKELNPLSKKLKSLLMISLMD